MGLTSRDYRHFRNAGVSLGLHVEARMAHLAVVFTHPNDRFNPTVARELLDIRFDANDATLRSLSLDRNVFSFPYTGSKPRIDIFKPLEVELAPILAERSRSNPRGATVERIMAEILVEVRHRRRMAYESSLSEKS